MYSGRFCNRQSPVRLLCSKRLSAQHLHKRWFLFLRCLCLWCLFLFLPWWSSLQLRNQVIWYFFRSISMYSGVTFCGATSTCVRLSRRTMTLCCSFCADCMRICAITSGFSFVNRLAFCLFVRLGDGLGECTVFIMIKISVGFRESNPASMILHWYASLHQAHFAGIHIPALLCNKSLTRGFNPTCVLSHGIKNE